MTLPAGLCCNRGRPAIGLVALVLAACSACSGGAAAQPLASNCRAVTLRDGDTSAPVTGVEDMAVDNVRDRLLVSAYDRRHLPPQGGTAAARTRQGGIYALPLGGESWRSPEVAATDLTRGFKQHGDLHPHGISLWQGSNGTRSLFVINRVFTASGRRWIMQPRVEIFDLRQGELIHRATLQDALMCAPNDLVAIGRSRFLVTNDHGSCAGAGRWLEDGLGLARSYVLYYDRTHFRKLVDGLDFANGIAVGPPGAINARRLYVAATRGRGVLVYDLQALLHAADPAPATREQRVIALGGGIDNLQWDGNGDLVLAQHPSLLRFALFRRGLRSTSPSRLLRIAVDPPGAPPAPTLLYAGDGTLLSGATVATVHGNRLLAGAAFADGMLVCDL